MIRRTNLIAVLALLFAGCSSDATWGDRGARFDAPPGWRGSATVTQEGGDDVINDPCARPDAFNIQDAVRVLKALKELQDEVAVPPQDPPPPADDGDTPPPGPLASNGFPPPDMEYVECATPAVPKQPRRQCRKFLFFNLPC